MKVTYFTREIIKYLKQQIEENNARRLAWLGCSPGVAVVHEALLGMYIDETEIYDNDPVKHGWQIQCSLHNSSSAFVIVKPLSELKNTEDTMYICANTHYNDFVKQLSAYGISKEKRIDLHHIQIKWINNNVEPILNNWHLLQGRSLQLEELKILKWFKVFCSDNNLKYYLGEGTLLGAVRHKGFIPWDDDIDVFMPYGEYLKLISLMSEQNEYILLDWRNEQRYPFQFAKVVEKGTYQIHPIPFGFFTLGCCIDVFPIAGYPDDINEIQEKYKRNKELDYCWDKWLIEADYLNDYSGDVREKITNEKYKLSSYESNNIGTMQQIAGRAWAIDRKCFETSISMQFEDDEFDVPEGYVEFLTARYGNYMEPPPEEERRIHSYDTYVVTDNDK